MPEILSFTKVYLYDTKESGITVYVKLSQGYTEEEFRAKIDTGASHCIFGCAHGQVLGLDIESGVEQTFSAATGSFLAYGHEVKLSVLGIETITTVYFAADENFTRNVLGRQGWLDKIRLGLIDYEGKLFLSSYDDDF